VLFDGTDLHQWRAADGGPATWVIRDGVIESVPESGYLYSADGFGDMQLHLEWASPAQPEGEGQQRGNSGLFLMGKYELQVLDSFANTTYADGQAAAIYGQYPPLVNACLPPGQWQSYDVIFRRPRFDQQGDLLAPARMTVTHNGILVQDNRALWGPTSWLKHRPYTMHADRLPLALQDHGNPVRYRNIWLRELPEREGPAPVEPGIRPYFPLPVAALDQYVGDYLQDDGTPTRVGRDEDSLWLQILGRERLALVPAATDAFFLRSTAGRVVFETELQAVSTPAAQATSVATSVATSSGTASGPSVSGDQQGRVRVATQLTLHLGGRTYPAFRQLTTPRSK
jgi:hypothetical protein